MVCVHAIPVENDAYPAYQGMPLFAEVGPLLLDPTMEKEVEESSELILNRHSQELLALSQQPELLFQE